MRIALDPYMVRSLPLTELPAFAASMGFSALELSPRDDLMPFYVHPRARPSMLGPFKRSLAAAEIQVASLLVGDYRWSSPDEAERTAAVRYWRAAIDIASELECPVMAAEFGGLPEAAAASEASFWRSIDDLLPLVEDRGITLTLEPHPYNFVEDNRSGVALVRTIGSPSVRYLFCVPHTFHLGAGVPDMIREAGPELAHVHLADTFNHQASSGNRFIVNPRDRDVRIHQHLNIGEGEIDWDAVFGTLHEVSFDGLMTSSVFGWEDRAADSVQRMQREIQRYGSQYWGQAWMGK